MVQRRRLRITLSGMIAALAVLGSVFVATPAQAYGTLTVKYAKVETDNCNRTGSLPVSDQGDYCYLWDNIDGTYFHKDPGGVALKVELWDANGMVGKFEFHPYGEHVWLYDTRNDGDAIYASICHVRDPENPLCVRDGLWTPVGSDNPVDLIHVDRSYDEGQVIRVQIWDNAAATDLIYTNTATA
jgi:hypothetical protein